MRARVFAALALPRAAAGAQCGMAVSPGTACTGSNVYAKSTEADADACCAACAAEAQCVQWTFHENNGYCDRVASAEKKKSKQHATCGEKTGPAPSPPAPVPPTPAPPVRYHCDTATYTCTASAGGRSTIDECRAACVAPPAPPPGPLGSPNILLVLGDDIGWGDHSYNCDNSSCGKGKENYCCANTPSLDEMSRGPHTVVFHRSYAGSACCSPTRAGMLTGRAPQRSCVDSAGGCGQSKAWKCKAKHQLPPNQYTVAMAAKQRNYRTFFMGKWHLGDFWDMGNSYAHPGMFGFDQWYATKASASSSMLNCGCFANANDCVTGGGTVGKKALTCTNYWYEDKSKSQYPTGAFNLTEKEPGDDNEFIVDHFSDWLDQGKGSPFLAALWLHTVHVPHPAMPEWYNSVPFPKQIGDYQGTLAQMDAQIGRLRGLLRDNGVADNTLFWYTTDNGPHAQSSKTGVSVGGYFEGADGAYFNGLRQCKGSIFEGGTRVPGLLEWPAVVSAHTDTYAVTGVFDVLPTVMDALAVTRPAKYDGWALDGMSILPWLKGGPPAARGAAYSLIQHNGANSKNTSQARIEDDMKLVFNPGSGQCGSIDNVYKNAGGEWYLFNLTADRSESHDLKKTLPAVFSRMQSDHLAWIDSVYRSRVEESLCGSGTPEDRANFDAGVQTGPDGRAPVPYNLDQLVDSGAVWPIPDEWYRS